jgi:hypothetical protein
MPSLQLSPKEFRTLADRVAELASDFLADLPNRQTVSSTSAVDTSLAFDLPLLEEGIGEAVIDDLVAIAEHVRAPTGRRLPYVIGSGEPISALADFYASVLNQSDPAERESAGTGLALEGEHPRRGRPARVHYEPPHHRRRHRSSRRRGPSGSRRNCLWQTRPRC